MEKAARKRPPLEQAPLLVQSMRVARLLPPAVSPRNLALRVVSDLKSLLRSV